MDPKIQEVCDLLDKLSDSILKLTNDDRLFVEIHGWTWASVNRHSLAVIPKNLSDNLRKISNIKIDQDTNEDLEEVCKMIRYLTSKTLPNMFNGNDVVGVFNSTMSAIRAMLEPLWGWEFLNDANALPKGLATRLRGIEAALNTIAPQKEDLEKWIKLIVDGKDAAISLPTDLELLKESRNKVEKYTTDSAINIDKIEGFYNTSENLLKKLTDHEKEAEKIVNQCNEILRNTTSVGLAAAFDERANKSNISKWIWVGGLIAALVIGAYIGSERVKLLTDSLNAENPHWSVISMHIILSALSIGAPLWFAWLSTKQINQSFKLSEDYAFKASVAKAYEGYRREAARIDPVFEARLFSSALTRLEEAPLRLVEGDTHGSPWHELFSSPAFQKAIDTVPELKDKFVEIAKDGIGVFKRKSSVEITKENKEEGNEPIL